MIRTVTGLAALGACSVLAAAQHPVRPDPPGAAKTGRGAAPPAAGIEWHTDLGAAEKLAAARGAPLLIVFR